MALSTWRQDLVYFGQNYGVYFLPVGFLVYLTLESYQIDFRSFYLAGKSVLTGFDPYLNYVGLRSEFYGPVNAETAPFSGFRYPPLAALVFAVLAWLPYSTARLLFTGIMLVLLGLLSFGLVRRSRFTIPGEALLFMMVSLPVLALVERGQVDSLIVYLTMLAYWLSQSSHWRSSASFLLAFAGNLKVFPLVVLLFYGVHRQWRFVFYTLFWTVTLFTLPYFYFGEGVYANFLKRTLPDSFGEISNPLPTTLQGQGLALGKIVQSVDAPDLLATHDFVNGFMNPLLSSNPMGSLISGLLLTGLLLIAVHGRPVDFQFYAFLNVINLYNPLSWIMGLAWYLPLFLYLYPGVTRLGQVGLLLPLFLPPFLNSNGIAAYGASLLLALAYRWPRWGRSLLRLHPSLPMPCNHTD